MRNTHKPSKRTVRRSKATRFPQAKDHNSARAVSRVSPDEMDVIIPYRKIGVLKDPAANLGYVELKPNDAYDVDPTLGSTESYGFDEYAALYSYYRVISYRYEATMTNLTDLGEWPTMMYVTNTNIRVSTAGSRWDLYTTNPYCQSKLLALPYSSVGTHTFRGSHSVSKILGSGVSETDDSYRALTTGSPTDLIWFGLAAENPTTSTGIAVAYDVKLYMKVRFYSREVDLTLAAMSTRIQAKMAAKEQFLLKKKLDLLEANKKQ